MNIECNFREIPRWMIGQFWKNITLNFSATVRKVQGSTVTYHSSLFIMNKDITDLTTWTNFYENWASNNPKNIYVVHSETKPKFADETDYPSGMNMRVYSLLRVRGSINNTQRFVMATWKNWNAANSPAKKGPILLEPSMETRMDNNMIFNNFKTVWVNVAQQFSP